MNGVWRVQGILATSRALGDYPLKDKKLIVCDPDVLSFKIKEHRPQFILLASDGLWDTHSNQEAVTHLKNYLPSNLSRGVDTLAKESLSKGSTDNITCLAIKF